MTILLACCSVLALLLAAYGLGHYLCGIVFLSRPLQARSFDDSTYEAVSILVPARNEGALAVQALESLFAQDHSGDLDIYLLIKDGSDTSLGFLRQLFVEQGNVLAVAQLEKIIAAAADTSVSADSQTHPKMHSTPNTIIKLTKRGNRSLYLALTGVDPNSEKINWLVAQLNTPFVAILDCDHQAQADWVRSSLLLLAEQPAAIIQGRRQPLHTKGFFSFWDSLHQHIGCELFNIAFARLGLTVFFTGTTAIMRTELLKASPLTPCITEDIDLSYTLFMQGLKVNANPYSGSREETSPNLYSFLARRRRWASGHTSAFFKHLPLLLSAPLRVRDRIQFLMHGTHYLIVLGVFALHTLIGVYFFSELSWLSQLTALAASLLLAFGIAQTQRTQQARTRLAEIAVLWVWFAPAFIVVTNVLHAALVGDLSRAALPILEAIQVLGLIGLCTPIVILLSGLLGFRQFKALTVFKSLCTYPIAFYLDIAGILLGLLDCLTGQNSWRAVSRGVSHTQTPLSLARSPATTAFSRIHPMLRITLVLAVVLFVIGVLYRPSTSLPTTPTLCAAQQFDTDPWIVPFKKASNYCTDGKSASPLPGNRSGNFKILRADTLQTIDPTYWDRMDTTFFCNQAVFSPTNIVQMPTGGVKLNIERQAAQDRAYTAADLTTKDTPEAKFKFGRFETVFKPTKEPGVVSSFFLYRFDPWQEIDAEFLGNDTSKMLLNVFYNPGQESDLYNYGLRGTPVVIDLGFDAALEFHRYAIEWEPEEIRWFVDDKLVHVRKAGVPTPIPQLPMRFHVNTWPVCSEELAGKFSPTQASMGSELKSVTISQWVPPPQKRLMDFVQSLNWWGSSGDWRQAAPWLQR